MVEDFVNPTIFWEYDLASLNLKAWAKEWGSFIIRQVFNRNVISLPKAIPAMLDYYGREFVEKQVVTEKWLTQEGIQTARLYFPHLRKSDFAATQRINTRKRQLARVGEFNPKL